ncbi:MAG: hypothetical protein JXR62_04885 [Bacilli bacterium]|nr:hypothetical protein [Bacilli bacterium]
MKDSRIKEYIILIFIELFVGAYFSTLIIIFQEHTTLKSVMDGIMVTGVVMVLFGWIVFLSTVGLYELIEYCVLYVIAKIRGVRLTTTLLEAMYLKDKNDAIAHRTIFISGFAYVIVGSILYYKYYTGI